ncbi:hypothetical protein LTR86_008264 [Recurvomyces mirabilis]|nr:hypothetical protein LTR86_008264 [Recurvomyces mirabilis]
MATMKRSPNVKFDEVPGSLPQESNPDDFDLSDVADIAIAKLNDIQLDHFTENAIWRDLLSFTGTYRTLYSQAKVADTLSRLSTQKWRSRFERKVGPAHKPRAAGNFGVSWVDVDLSFSLNIDGLAGEGSAIASVAHSQDGEWRIWMLRTWLECFKGHGDPDTPIMSSQMTNGTNGTSEATHNGHTETSIYDAIVVGGGQAGLSTAGRLKAIGVSYLLIESRPEIGDVWNTRYESLRWHTSKLSCGMPFDQTTFPDDDDYMLPTKRIGAGHKAWSEKYGINVRTSTTVDSARWQEAEKIWTVNTTSGEQKQIFQAHNLVLSIGTGHLTPVLPDWAQPDKVAASQYKGTILHASRYMSSKPWSGKRGLVVGTANTAHDVAEDMANAAMQTTMMQRGSTYVFPAEWLHKSQDVHYNPSKHPADADKECFTYPNKILRTIINRFAHMHVKKNSARFDRLEEAGFKLDRFGDVYDNLYVRFGGHYIDIGGSKRIADGEIKVETTAVESMTEDGLLLEDGRKLSADLIVLATGFDHDFRRDAAKLIGQEAADQMDDFWGVDAEGEIRGHAKFAGHPNLYYHGGDVRMGRFFSRFIALQIQAEVLLGKPMERYTD